MSFERLSEYAETLNIGLDVTSKAVGRFDSPGVEFTCRGQTMRVSELRLARDSYGELNTVYDWAKSIIFGETERAQQNQAAQESERATRTKRHRSANLRIKKALRKRGL